MWKRSEFLATVGGAAAAASKLTIPSAVESSENTQLRERSIASLTSRSHVPPAPSAALRKKLISAAASTKRFLPISPTANQYWDFQSENDAPDQYSLQSIDYTVSDQKQFNKNVSLTVDELTLNAPLIANGFNITIFARKIICGPNGSVVTDGTGLKSGNSYAQGDHAASGTTVAWPKSANGSVSDPAGPGSDAGKITIWVDEIVGKLVCSAVGASGGRGRDGGNGASGITGSPGRSGMDKGCQGGDPGGPGGTGGDAGAGGAGGAAGNGGAIAVNVSNGVDVSAIQMTSSPGNPGAGGNAGNPGAGGTGGPGGANYHQQEGQCNQVHCVFSGNNASSGGNGAPGASAGIGALGTVGQAGNTASSIGSAADFFAAWPTNHLRMVLHKISEWYLNANSSADYGRITSSAIFFERITTDQPSVTDLHQELSGVIGHLRLGVDYFGYAYNYVPLTTFNLFDDTLDSSIKAATAVENAYITYWQNLKDAQAAQQALQATLTAAQAALAASQTALQNILTERQKIEGDIGQLTTLLQSLYDGIQTAHTDFVADVEHQTSCHFVDVIVAAGMIVAVATTVGSAIPAITTAITTLLPGSGTAPQGRIDAVTTITGKLGDVAAAYAKAKGALQPKTVSDMDFQKLAMTQQDYDNFLQPYLNLASARHLRDLVDAYCEINQTRNQRLLDYTASFDAENRLLGEIKSRQAYASDITGQLAEIDFAQSIEATSYMGTLYQQTKRDLLRLLWMKKKACEFETLSGVAVQYNDLDVAAIDGQSRSINTLRTEFQTEAETRYVPFTVPVQLLLLPSQTDVSALPSPFQNGAVPYLPVGDALKGLSTARPSMTFNLPLYTAAFANLGWSSIRLDGIHAVLVGAQPPTGNVQPFISLDLRHSGVSQIVDPTSHTVRYTHTPVKVTVAYDPRNIDPSVAKTNLLGDNRLYVGISPFATWTLSVNGGPDALPDLSGVVGVLLTFFGKSQSFETASNPFRQVGLARRSAERILICEGGV